MRLLSYNFKIQYRPGYDNPSDYMSRHPSPLSKPSKESEQSEEYIPFVVTSAVPKSMFLDDIRSETIAYATLWETMLIIRENKWHKLDDIVNPGVDKSEVMLLRNVKEEVTVSTENDILLRRNRIVIPRKLRPQAIKLAHIGHQGLVKTNSLLREKVWFPLIDQLVK